MICHKISHLETKPKPSHKVSKPMVTLEQQIAQQVYASGETVTDIARSLGCDRAHLHRVMKGTAPLSNRLRLRMERHGFTFQEPGPPPPPDPVEQVRIMADQAIQEAKAGNIETAAELWKAGHVWNREAQAAGHPCKDDASKHLDKGKRPPPQMPEAGKRNTPSRRNLW